MSILFNRCVSLQVDPFIFNIRKIQSQFSQRCSLLPPPSCLCFSHPPSLVFFKDSDFLIKYPFIDGKSLHSFPSMFLPGGSHEDALQVHHCLFSFFSGGFNSSFVDHIFSSFQMFSHAGALLNHPLLVIQLFRSAEDISEDSCFHSAFVQALSRLLSHSSHLIQPAQSIF